MSLMAQADEWVRLVDRAARGGDEIQHDGVILVLPKGEIETKPVHQELVKWLYATDKKRVWTTDGQWVHRYAVEQPNQWLIDHCGPEVGDTSPIEIDPSRIEGWDTSEVSRDYTDPNTRILRVNVPASELRERQGAGDRVTASAR